MNDPRTASTPPVSAGATQPTYDGIFADNYDEFYRTKDYGAEAAFVLDRFKKVVALPIRDALELGCGTGVHAVELATRGVDTIGFDRSPNMIRLAEERRASSGTDVARRLQFGVGEILDLELGREFDVAFSLFHVMSYLSKEGEFDAALRNVRRHLRTGGAFLFDVWHGHAVIAEPPEPRERVLTVGSHRIRRTTTPEWDRTRGVVHVHYLFEDTDTATGAMKSEREEHVMRYFFEEDLTRGLTDAGFETVEVGEWLTGLPPSPNAFGIYALARAI